MDFAEIETITQGRLEIMNPISEEKLLRAGKIAGLAAGKRVLDSSGRPTGFLRSSPGNGQKSLPPTNSR
ncbi:MAG TPA: hypothetical protein O0X38_07505 [Methanocorpusculum sp.]|nr:hypothetical protein [Methanocorpusculum sp.]